MATRKIRNLINNSIDKPISNSKISVKNESKKQIAKIKEQLPNPDDLKSKVISKGCTLNTQSKVQRLYSKNKKHLEKLLNRVEKSKSKLSKIQAKLIEIQVTIGIITTILEALADILIGLEIIVRVSPAGLAASSGPAANGLVIKSLSDAIDYAKAKIKEYGGLVQAIIVMLPKYLAKASKIGLFFASHLKSG